MATVTPQSLFPLGLFPAAQEASLFPFPLSTPRTGLSDTAHVPGLAAPPGTHWVPWAARMAQEVSTHMCTDPRPRAHTWWPLHTHCTCVKLTHGHVHV